MKSLDDYLLDAEQAHGHLCAGQVLGVRMAMLGLQQLGIDDPQRGHTALNDPPGETGKDLAGTELDFYPLAYERPGPVMQIYRLKGAKCG